jgi:hypothetical protein
MPERDGWLGSLSERQARSAREHATLNEDRFREFVGKRDESGLSDEEASELGALVAAEIEALPSSTIAVWVPRRNLWKWGRGGDRDCRDGLVERWTA